MMLTSVFWLCIIGFAASNPVPLKEAPLDKEAEVEQVAQEQVHLDETKPAVEPGESPPQDVAELEQVQDVEEASNVEQIPSENEGVPAADSAIQPEEISEVEHIPDQADQPAVEEVIKPEANSELAEPEQVQADQKEQAEEPQEVVQQEAERVEIPEPVKAEPPQEAVETSPEGMQQDAEKTENAVQNADQEPEVAEAKKEIPEVQEVNHQEQSDHTGEQIQPVEEVAEIKEEIPQQNDEPRVSQPLDRPSQVEKIQQTEEAVAENTEPLPENPLVEAAETVDEQGEIKSERIETPPNAEPEQADTKEHLEADIEQVEPAQADISSQAEENVEEPVNQIEEVQQLQSDLKPEQTEETQDSPAVEEKEHGEVIAQMDTETQPASVETAPDGSENIKTEEKIAEIVHQDASNIENLPVEQQGEESSNQEQSVEERVQAPESPEKIAEEVQEMQDTSVVVPEQEQVQSEVVQQPVVPEVPASSADEDVKAGKIEQIPKAPVNADIANSLQQSENNPLQEDEPQHQESVKEQQTEVQEDEATQPIDLKQPEIQSNSEDQAIREPETTHESQSDTEIIQSAEPDQHAEVSEQKEVEPPVEQVREEILSEESPVKEAEGNSDDKTIKSDSLPKEISVPVDQIAAVPEKPAADLVESQPLENSEQSDAQAENVETKEISSPVIEPQVDLDSIQNQDDVAAPDNSADKIIEVDSQVASDESKSITADSLADNSQVGEISQLPEEAQVENETPVTNEADAPVEEVKNENVEADISAAKIAKVEEAAPQEQLPIDEAQPSAAQDLESDKRIENSLAEKAPEIVSADNQAAVEATDTQSDMTNENAAVPPASSVEEHPVPSVLGDEKEQIGQEPEAVKESVAAEAASRPAEESGAEAASSGNYWVKMTPDKEKDTNAVDSSANANPIPGENNEEMNEIILHNVVRDNLVDGLAEDNVLPIEEPSDLQQAEDIDQNRSEIQEPANEEEEEREVELQMAEMARKYGLRPLTRRFFEDQIQRRKSFINPVVRYVRRWN